MTATGGYYFEDLTVGMKDSFAKTVTDADIVMFAGVTGDTNPVHIDSAYASGTMFKGRIAHGMLTASFISTVCGTRLPGPGCIYMKQSLVFKAPVMINETVIAEVEVAELNAERKRVVLRTVCRVGDKVVVEGEALLMVPSRAQLATAAE